MSLKCSGFTGTGLPHPMTGAPVRIPKIGKKTVPIISMWGMGERLTLPKSLAVGSPNLSATQPCAASWQLKENKNRG